MGLIMEEPATTKIVSKKETPEHSDSSDEEEDEESGEEEESGSSSPIRMTDAELFKYRWCSWPELLGLDAAEARRIIEEDKPDLYVEVLSQRQMQTLCYVTRRVRLIVDSYNRVVQTPRVG